MSQREYARRRGVSHTAVQKAIRDGRISAVRGKLDPDIADREWAENTDQSAPLNSVAGSPKHRRTPGAPSAPIELDGGNGSARSAGTATGYARARAAKEAAMAQIAKLDLDERLGSLVRTDEVRLSVFNMARKARDQLLAIPGRVAPVVAALGGDVAEVERVLLAEVERVCQDLSDDPGAAARPPATAKSEPTKPAAKKKQKKRAPAKKKKPATTTKKKKKPGAKRESTKRT